MFSSWLEKMGKKKRERLFNGCLANLATQHAGAVELFKRDRRIMDIFLLDTHDPTFAHVVKRLKETESGPRLDAKHERYVTGTMDRDLMEAVISPWDFEDGLPDGAPAVVVLAERGASIYTPEEALPVIPSFAAERRASDGIAGHLFEGEGGTRCWLKT